MVGKSVGWGDPMHRERERERYGVGFLLGKHRFHFFLYLKFLSL